MASEAPTSEVVLESLPASSARQSRDWSERAVEALERRWLWALTAMLLLDCALLTYMGRGLSFYYDEWEFIIRDWGGGLHFMLAPHVGNLTFFSAAGYKVLFHLVGLNHYEFYRLFVVALHLIAATLVFALAQRRLSKAPALLAAALVLFLGAAWEDLLWAFQFGYLLAMVGGLAAWLLLEREDRHGDLAATLCLTLAIGSASIGIAMLGGIAVEIAWRRQWSRMFVVAVPAILYLLWYSHYGESQLTPESLIHAPGFAEDLAAMAFGALIGRALEWGRPLAVIGILALLARLVRPLPVSARLAGLIATGVGLWLVIAFARSTISPPESSRYVYLGAVVIVLIGVELLAELKIEPRAVVIAAVLVTFFAASGLSILSAGAGGLRQTSKTVTAELGALEIARAYAPPSYQPDPSLAPPVTAGPYLHTVRSMGSSPADTTMEIAATNPVARAAADHVLLTLEPPNLATLTTGKRLDATSTPRLSTLYGGTARSVRACVALQPAAAAMTAVFALPRGGVLIRNKGRTAATVAIKRFADGFTAVVGSVGTGSTALTIPPDSASVPWTSQISSSSPLVICALGA